MAKRMLVSLAVAASLLATAIVAEFLGPTRGEAGVADWRDGYGVDDRTIVSTALVTPMTSADATVRR